MNRSLPVLLLLVLFLSGCGNAPTPDAQQGKPVVYVEVERAKKAPIVATTSATGTITSKSEVKIIAQTEGKIVKLNVEEGDKVKKGEVLVKLDDSILAAQAAEAEANMEDARSVFERAGTLFNSKLISQQDYDQSKTRYNVAKARFKYQKALLDYTTITAPISGVITFRGVREGDIAVPRTVLLTVSDPTTLVIEVTVSELEIPKIKLGDAVKITVDAYPQCAFKGKVRRIFPASDPVTRLVKVEVELTERDERLFPGLFARAELTTSSKPDAVVLSNDAIVTSSTGQTTAFVVEDSLVFKRELTLGIKDGTRAEVLRGVKEGDKVVVVGQSALNDKMAVRITKERS
ncbi:MAG: efflux RND transporter periplasmic adaptor subunit [Ignavibacteriales bacterium]|nr:efflux RND transporter periplasmic adaptor subunit [Ignavibacteriales bacterium]